MSSPFSVWSRGEGTTRETDWLTTAQCGMDNNVEFVFQINQPWEATVRQGVWWSFDTRSITPLMAIWESHCGDTCIITGLGEAWLMILFSCPNVNLWIWHRYQAHVLCLLLPQRYISLIQASEYQWYLQLCVATFSQSSFYTLFLYGTLAALTVMGWMV